MFMGDNEIFWVSSWKTVCFWVSLLIINESEICGIRGTKRFDCKMSVQMPITFTDLRLTISCLETPMEYVKVPLSKLFSYDIFVRVYQIVTFYVYLGWTILFDTCLILCRICCDFKFKKKLMGYSNLRRSRFVLIGTNGIFWLSSLKRVFD